MTVAASARSKSDTAAMIRDVGIIPVIRADSAADAIRVAETLADSGISIAEITMTVPDALSAIAALSRKLGARMLIGAGTVTDTDTARRALAAGARFIVSPCVVPEVIDQAAGDDVVMMAGALTPTEVFTAAQRGATFVKVFPANSVGGAAYLRALKGPFPDIALIPTGGVSLESIPGLFAAGAAAVGVGGELISRDALRRGDFDAIGVLATQFLRAVQNARSAA
jgi:2-dehydro-3-deoxyphosphogluconate aldolase/(4S)-4-hydroxy-2-oxoglutarate aldolase